MALSRVKTWNAAETLTASDLNAEFNNICNHFGSLTNADIDSTASYVMGELVVGTGITSADGGQLHVHTATAGTIQAVADADEAVFENSGASGITILSGATSTGNIAFGDSGDADNGLIKYTHGSTPTLGVTVNATAVQSIAAAATTLAHDLEIYQDVNNADSAIKIGTSATEALFVEALNGGSNKTLEELRFTTKTASGTANHGKMSFYVDEVNIGNVNDGGITLESGMVLTGNVTGNASGTAATVTGGTQAAITTCTNLVTVGTIGTGVWQGTAVASAYLDADTAHLSTTQTFTGDKTFTGTLTVGVDDTGKDVKFFGASAGAFMLYDESADTLEVRGPSADATTSTGKLKLTTALTDINDNDVLGRIDFAAPLEAGGTDAILAGGAIWAEAEATFTSSVNSTALVFGTNTSAAATERVRIDSGGSLHVTNSWYNNQTTDYISIQVAESQNNVAALAFGVGANPTTGTSSNYHHAWIQGIVTNSGGALTGDLAFSTNGGDNNVERMRIDSSGNVGIAMTAGGSHKLDVTGSAGLSTGTAWTNTSDARIKKDVATITGATAKLKRLRPVSYKYTDQYLSVHSEIDGAKTYYSFVADEYETVFPDAVSNQGDLVKITPAVIEVQAQDAVLYVDGDTDIPDGKSVGDVRTPAVEAVEGREEVKETLLTNLKQYTPHDLQMFLTAAVQELDARIAALESA
jgi:hypothetical protein